MDNIIEYDFHNLIMAIDKLSTGDSYACREIQDELNKFLPEFNCTNVIYTENTDKEFFGIIIRPLCEGDILDRLFNSKDPYRFESYTVEFDSQLRGLFSNELGSSEICALLIHDICEMNSPTSCSEQFIAHLDYICAAKHITLNLNTISSYKKVFTMVMEDTIRTLTSVFNKDLNETVLATDIIRGYGLDTYFDQAIEKLKSHRGCFANELNCRPMVLTWYLSLIDDINSNNRYIITVLRKSLDYTGSRSLRVSIINAITELEQVTDAADRRYRALTEAASTKKSSFISRMKYSGMRALEEDLYEFNMRLRNVENQNDAILLMRQINNRMEILDDYLRNEEISDQDRTRWEKVFEKYEKVRDDLSKKTVYNKKMYGLFVDYNALQKMSDNGMMNTYY